MNQGGNSYGRSVWSNWVQQWSPDYRRSQLDGINAGSPEYRSAQPVRQDVDHHRRQVL